ncbi:unnamed protein product [Rotaria sordida]|uniref:Uncharacterized protein n=1 Tax=Rotaria sordida TaxID=392033 RepID=A0A814G4Z3_9BILA|nr:unnamed protein product [Rotaria sordida]CAF1017243.1 unnamed protein product [Rotaria sordida]CAF3898245.1 unnamed protein product [Rotaria sordida]CAF3917770.1 unnamed protein product [Rotaria sordida]
MDRQWHIRQQLELLSSPTSIQYNRIEKYSSVVEGIRRVRRILAGDNQEESEKLIRACCRNDIDTVKWLFENIDIDSINLKKGINRSPLHEAVLHRDGRSLVRLLCQYGADPKQRDSLGRTPIHYAASYGHIDIIIDLINFSRISLSTLVDVEGRCPLMYACGEGHLSVCQWLVEHGNGDYYRQDDRGRSCLVYACRAGHIEIVQWLLSILSPESTHTGWHPLHFACSTGHLNIVKILLQYNQRIGNVVTNTGHSALFMAMHSATNSIEMVKCLLDSHSSVQLTSQDIQDLNCNKSLILLLAQRRHSLVYLLQLIEKTNYSLSLIRLLLLSEHIYCTQDLLSIPYHQSLILYHLQNSLKLKQITRCLIRKSIDTSNKIDLLEINGILKKFIRFEYL